MWNDKKSILLSRICVIIFIAAVAVILVAVPWIAALFTPAFREPLETANRVFLATVYTGAVPALILLFSLFRLLTRINNDQVFVEKNVASLRLISWCCFLGAVICAASAFFYMPWSLVAAAAVFVGLIVRVVKNVFSRAVALQDDADHTI
jgi:hypothetical protein